MKEVILISWVWVRGGIFRGIVTIVGEQVAMTARRPGNDIEANGFSARVPLNSAGHDAGRFAVVVVVGEAARRRLVRVIVDKGNLAEVDERLDVALAQRLQGFIATAERLFRVPLAF